MKRLCLSLFATLAVLVIGLDYGIASAHVLKTDSTVGAILHINPDDNPKSGRPTTYTLSFKDTAGSFELQACSCTATIKESGKIVSQQQLQAIRPLESQNTVTFPKPDIYLLEVEGNPVQPDTFQPFKLTYTLRVESGTSGSSLQPFPPLLALGLGSMLALILLGAYATNYDVTKR